MIERFSVECRKTKSNYSDQSQNLQTIQLTNQNTKQIHVARAKSWKTHAGKSRLVLVLLLID